MVFLLNFLNCCSDSFVRRRPFILLSLYTCTLGHFSYWTESFFLSHRALAWDQLNWYTVISQWWHCYGDIFFFFLLVFRLGWRGIMDGASVFWNWYLNNWIHQLQIAQFSPSNDAGKCFNVSHLYSFFHFKLLFQSLFISTLFLRLLLNIS
jgi:hypothetical protein